MVIKKLHRGTKYGGGTVLDWVSETDSLGGWIMEEPCRCVEEEHPRTVIFQCFTIWVENPSKISPGKGPQGFS